jgi:Peroxide stress protein YaaA
VVGPKLDIEKVEVRYCTVRRYPHWVRDAYSLVAMAIAARLRSTLVIIPCSASKRPGAGSGGSDRPILADLPPALAAELAESRAQNAQLAGVAGPTMAAWCRYTGSLYVAGNTALRELAAADAHVLIVSGAYGVVRANEPIAMYNMRFEGKRWPDRIVQRCFEAYARRNQLTAVRALMGASTSYARVVRSTRWAAAGVNDALLIAPDFHRPGAIREVPAAIGSALVALVEDQLVPDWATPTGVAFRWERMA